MTRSAEATASQWQKCFALLAVVPIEVASGLPDELNIWKIHVHPAFSHLLYQYQSLVPRVVDPTKLSGEVESNFDAGSLLCRGLNNLNAPCGRVPEFLRGAVGSILQLLLR